MEGDSEVHKTLAIVNLYRQPTDFAFWQTQSYISRLAALETIRQEYHHWRYGAEPRFQRVYTIIKR
jgi:hypothetical protein